MDIFKTIVEIFKKNKDEKVEEVKDDESEDYEPPIIFNDEYGLDWDDLKDENDRICETGRSIQNIPGFFGSGRL